MKTCPVCKANCFDDMDVCFGCLHDFSRQGPASPQHARPPVLESSIEEDLEPEEAVAPMHSRVDRSPSAGRASAPERSVSFAAPSQIAVAPGVHLDVPEGFRLVLRFEPS